MNLVIVESAAKAKTIEKYLNSIQELNHLGKFKVLASLGHIQDLPDKELGINTTEWSVNYIPLKTKSALIKTLKSESKNASMVYIASDMDLEGNAIAYHLKNILQLKKPKYARVIFNEITKGALKTAFLNPGDIDMNMFAAQETRRILDRIVGYELSPLLWRRFVTQSLSAGRVQSAGLKMIVTRYKNACEHNPETYWTCESNFNLEKSNSSAIDTSLSATLYLKETDKIMYWTTDEQTRINFESFLNKLISKQNTPWIINYSQKKVLKNPSAPFTTSTFQQEVYNLYHIPPKVAMQSAQRLYEAGYITYMRTDSVQLSDDSQKDILKYISTHYGADNGSPRIFKTKQQNAQEAHEAIRPTDPNMSSSQLPETISEIDRKIYSLIWRRVIASQMIAAEYNEISYIIDIPDNEFNSTYYFRGKISLLTKEGYLVVYSPDTKIDHQICSMWKNIVISKLQKIYIQKLKGLPYVTKAQTLYNESSIIKSFEKEGIGRPSTYATIIDKLYTRKYIEKGECPQKEVTCFEYEWLKETVDNVNTFKRVQTTLTSATKEKDLLLPTSLGIRVIEYLEQLVPFLLDTAFTSHMESDLDKIMQGNTNKITILNDFYTIFHASVEKAKNEMKAITSSKTKDESREAKLTPKQESIIHKYTNDLMIVKTKYGPALLQLSTSKWYSIKSFIEWKNKDYSDVTEQDIRFIMSLPINIETTDRKLCLGPYGLYIKDATNNYILPEEYWGKAYNNTLNNEDIQFIKNLQPLQSKKPNKKPYEKGKKTQQSKDQHVEKVEKQPTAKKPPVKKTK
jgi:DNA topoisomerase-1